MADEPPLRASCSRHFLSWLAESGISLGFTTYQTNRLFLIGLKEDGRLSIFERHFERPMGLYATPERLYMSSRWQIWRFEDALPQGSRTKASTVSTCRGTPTPPATSMCTMSASTATAASCSSPPCTAAWRP